MTTPAVPPAVLRNRRLQLLLVAALFFGPFALAFYFYYGGATPARGRTNHGELIEPARPLPASGLVSAPGAPAAEELLRSKWSLATVSDGRCETACRKALGDARAVRLALGPDGERVRRVLIVAAPCCTLPLPQEEPADRALATGWTEGNAGRALLELFPGKDVPGALYLVDPRGNLLMRYAPGADPKGLLKDLERLLRLSQIG
jgi:cytochrome oxidase Cu insertion factor (SCO1/SenC/PrrC family)